MSVHNNIYVKDNVLINGNIRVDGIDSRTATTLSIGYTTSSKVEIADSGIVTEVKGNLNVKEGVYITGNTTTTGYVQFSDISSPANPSVGEGRLYKKNGNDGLFWKPDTIGIEVDLTTAPQYVRTVITNLESPYTILATDEIIGVDTTNAAVTITLPQISTIGGTNNYKKYHIVDEGGNSSINNITVNTTGGNTINKIASPMLINVDHTSITLYNNGVSNWIIL